MIVDIVIKSREEILKNISNAGVFWNDPCMSKFCGKVLKNVKVMKNWDNESLYTYNETSTRSWSFAESWIEEVIYPQLLEDELFIL